MQEIIYNLISFALAAIAFAFGSAAVLRPGKPLYCRILIAAVGCYLLQELSSIGEYICGGFDYYVTVSNIGVFSCACLMVTAEGLVLESGKSRRVRFLSLAVSAVFIVLLMGVFTAVITKEGKWTAILTVVTMLPMLPTAYMCAEHFICAGSEQGNLAATKWCTVFALSYFLLTGVYGLVSIYCPGELTNVFSIVVTLSIVALTASVVRGAQKWKC